MRKARLRISIPKDDEELVVRKGENTKIIINGKFCNENLSNGRIRNGLKRYTAIVFPLSSLFSMSACKLPVELAYRGPTAATFIVVFCQVIMRLTCVLGFVIDLIKY